MFTLSRLAFAKAPAKSILDRASLHTWKRWFRRHFCNRAKLRLCRRSCLFRKRSLPFSDLLLKVFLLKRKKIATQGWPWTSNSDLSYPTLSSLPLHYHTPTIQTRQNSEQKAESHISDKCSYYTGWQEMISDILRTEHGLNLQKALNDNFPKSLCKTSFIREPVTGLS